MNVSFFKLDTENSSGCEIPSPLKLNFQKSSKSQFVIFPEISLTGSLSVVDQQNESCKRASRTHAGEDTHGDDPFPLLNK